MLTPLEIHNKEFKRTFRGYDEDEVDEFLDLIIADYEQLYRENIELREMASKAEGNTGQYKELEDTLKNALVVAQRTSDQMKSNAEKEAQMIIQNATTKANQIVQSAHEQNEAIVKDYERLKNQVNLFRVKMKSFLEGQLVMVNEYGEEIIEEKNHRVIAKLDDIAGKQEKSNGGQKDSENSESKELDKINTYDFQKPDEPVSDNTIIFSKEEIAAAIEDNTRNDNSIF